MIKKLNRSSKEKLLIINTKLTLITNANVMIIILTIKLSSSITIDKLYKNIIN